jgi:hypothetical protein
MSGEKSTRLTGSVVNSRGAPMAKRLMIWALAAILLFGAFPMLSLLAALLFSSAFGCNVDESGPHPCVVLGLDFGGLLYSTAIGGIWFSLFTILLAGLALIVWLIVLIVLLLLRRRRRAAAPAD